MLDYFSTNIWFCIICGYKLLINMIDNLWDFLSKFLHKK